VLHLYKMDGFKLMLFSLMPWKKLQRFLMVVLCSLLDYQTLLEHIMVVLYSILDYQECCWST
jgi:hypothetical protein